MIDILFIYINNKALIFSPDTIPISEGYILAYLKQKGYSGQVLVDLKDRPLSLPTLKDFLKRHRPIVVGFSTYQATIERARFYACFIKKFFPQIKIVFGGPQTPFMPKLNYHETFNLTCCYFQLNRLKETKEILEKIYNENNLYLLYLLSKTYLLLGDRKKAREISFKLASAKVDFQLCGRK